MKSKLYIGNLSFNTENIDSEKLFSESGTVVSIDIIKDKSTGRNERFGFVEMKNQQEATDAIEKFNGFDFKERTIKVNLAKDKNSYIDRG